MRRLRRALHRVRVVALVGPRQCGKTTLARRRRPARSLGVSEATVRRYLDLLTGLFMVFPRDTGLLHALLGVRTQQELLAHPRCGASWEGYAIEEVLKATPFDEAYCWGTCQGAELDLLLLRAGKRLGVEVKRADAPALTPAMRIAFADLGLDRLVVLYPGSRRYSLADRITVVPLGELAAGRADALGPPGRRRA